ncbi:antibiotic biosynthesis monooxygenase family protein [Pleionea mediterranea]|jgi:heme-degrading monooxygenase HmoA|uniref:Antibiotic biosynthesis monooxygenase n=1 Tax=Pleionea mediterranea TaxID=523701 RepID=A0A316FZ00_9GAMM|nr:antibiotic biosynthesis monooxygenase family protein [Pleionea mediterranea]PWK52916.1 antibiotic biosynthesis monooxygenase [Pleionea mediterranea]
MIRVIIERQLKPDSFDEYATVIRKAKKEAARKTGFMGGELYFDLNDNDKIVIIAAWDTLENWELWDKSEERKVLTEELAPLMLNDETITILKSSR